MGNSNSIIAVKPKASFRRRQDSLAIKCEKVYDRIREIDEPKIVTPPNLLSSSQNLLKESWDEFFLNRINGYDSSGMLFSESSTTVPGIGTKVSVYRNDFETNKNYTKGTVIDNNPFSNYFSLETVNEIKTIHTEDVNWRWSQTDNTSVSIRQYKSLDNLVHLSSRDNVKECKRNISSRSLSPQRELRSLITSKNRIVPI